MPTSKNELHKLTTSGFSPATVPELQSISVSALSPMHSLTSDEADEHLVANAHIGLGCGISVYPAFAARKAGHGNCMVRRQIASSIVVVGGLVCANVSGLFVETSSWP